MSCHVVHYNCRWAGGRGYTSFHVCTFMKHDDVLSIEHLWVCLYTQPPSFRLLIIYLFVL